jgi:hypothetical protein
LGTRTPLAGTRELQVALVMVAANVNSRTGDPALAMQWIGDDVRQATRYIQERAADFQAVADHRSTR